MFWIQIIGYAASVLIAASLAMRSLIKLRAVGLVGSLLFMVYGLLIHSMPVFLLNLVNVGFHSYHLWQIKTASEYFEIMYVPHCEAPFFRRFIKFYRSELAYFFPEFDPDKLKEPLIYFVFRDMIPAGLFIAQPRNNSLLEIVVDYVVPNFRDMKSARYLFFHGRQKFLEGGYTRFSARAYVPEHRKYLKKMGFSEEATGAGQLYTKLI